MTRTKSEILQELKQAGIHIEEPGTSLPHSRKVVLKVPGDSPVTADEYMTVIQGLV
ncbi:MAG TPA: hypothetical protein VER35_02730 [Candidatus Limnocylindrales bacterium]|nr:hypothetical protein [Candidatus Limnocylindrales bacterium]